MRLGRWAGALGAVALCTVLSAQPVDLSKDERLQKPITVREPFIPLKQLIADLSKQLGVSLAATSEIAEDKVCVLVRERPAHEALQRLADTLRYEWQPSEATDGYRLYQPHGERVREQQLRQALLQARRQEVERALRVLIDLARRVRWEDLASLSEQERQRLSPDQARLLPRLYDVSVYAAARVMGDFRLSEWQRFWQGETLVFSSAPRAGELPLAPELHQLILEGRLSVAARSLSEPARGESREGISRLRLRWDGWRGEMTIETERQSDATPRRAMEGLAIRPVGVATTIRTLSARELVDATRSQKKATALLDDHSLNKVWREWANVSDRLTPSRRANTSPEHTALPDYLQRSPLASLMEIANRYGLDLYADVYRLELFLETFLETLPATRTLLLNKTLPTDWSEVRALFWLRQEGEALMARHKDYFWLRPSEIPEDWLRPLEAKKQKRESLTLDDWARLANSLNELQIERLTGLPLMANAYVRTTSTLNLRSLVEAIPALRFWASLTPQQKQIALSGEPLLLRRMSIPQQQRFQQALYAPARQTRFVSASGVATQTVATQIFSLDSSRRATTAVQEAHFILVQGRSAISVESPSDAPVEAKTIRILPFKPSESWEAESSPSFYLFRFAFENLTREYAFSPDIP